MNLEWKIALRYLSSKRRRGLISVIGWIAIGGVFVGVAALVIVMSVMNGLQDDLREKILTNTPHLLIQKYNSEPIQEYQALAEKTPGVHFVGRLATYRYYNMDQVVAQALTLYARLSGRRRVAATAAQVAARPLAVPAESLA